MSWNRIEPVEDHLACATNLASYATKNHAHRRRSWARWFVWRSSMNGAVPWVISARRQKKGPTSDESITPKL